VSALLQETWPLGSFDLAIHVVAEPEMTRLNETYLRHKGSTDVITFDYTEEAGQASGLPRSVSTAPEGAGLPHHNGGLAKSHLPTTKEWGEGQGEGLVHCAGDKRDPCPGQLHGEIFVCLDEAVSQARLFRTTWQSELVRYVVHGVLHLLGYDDTASRSRQKMKEAEDALVRQLARQFEMHRLRVTDM
jgi:rRNA maturation RNase YbeY